MLPFLYLEQNGENPSNYIITVTSEIRCTQGLLQLARIIFIDRKHHNGCTRRIIKKKICYAIIAMCETS